MKKTIYFLIINSIIVSSLAACGSKPSVKRESVAPGYLYAGEYIDIRSPNSEGWYLANSNNYGMGFIKGGVSSNESFVAQVSIFPLEKSATEQEFIALIELAVEQNTYKNRFTVLESTYNIYDKRGYPCVKASIVAEDREARTGKTSTEVLLIQSESLYCRHPVRPETGFSISYSHRGAVAIKDLISSANEFFSGVQVPSNGDL